MNTTGEKIRSILGGIICTGGCTHIWHILAGEDGRIDLVEELGAYFHFQFHFCCGVFKTLL